MLALAASAVSLKILQLLDARCCMEAMHQRHHTAVQRSHRHTVALGCMVRSPGSGFASHWLCRCNQVQLESSQQQTVVLLSHLCVCHMRQAGNRLMARLRVHWSCTGSVTSVTEFCKGSRLLQTPNGQHCRSSAHAGRPPRTARPSCLTCIFVSLLSSASLTAQD